MQNPHDNPSVALTLSNLLAQGLARVDAQLLLLHLLGKPAHERAWLLAHDTDPVDGAALQQLAALEVGAVA